MRGSWRLNKDSNILTSPAPPDIAVCLSHSPGLLNREPGAPSAGGWFSLPHLLSNWPELPVHWVILLFYAHSVSSHGWPTEYATSAVFGMACFDHHRAEITVMQFTGHPLPVHQFVTVPWDFNPVPYCQPSSPTQSLPITGQRNMQLPPSLEWHVWPGRRSIYHKMLYQKSMNIFYF